MIEKQSRFEQEEDIQNQENLVDFKCRKSLKYSATIIVIVLASIVTLIATYNLVFNPEIHDYLTKRVVDNSWSLFTSVAIFLGLKFQKK